MRWELKANYLSLLQAAKQPAATLLFNSSMMELHKCV